MEQFPICLKYQKDNHEDSKVRMTNEENIEKLLDKIENINKHLYSIDMTLVKQHASLEVHMARTTTNEKLIEIIVADMKPIKKHVNHVEGGVKLLGLLALILGLLSAIVKLHGAV